MPNAKVEIQSGDLFQSVLGGSLSRRSLLKRGVALGFGGAVLGGLLAACGDDDDVTDPVTEPDDDVEPDDDTEDEPDDEPADDEDVSTGGELVILTANEPDTMDPHQTQSRYATLVITAMFDSLMHMDADLEIRPGLAISWELSEDAQTWTIELREGVTFHDGEPFNAEAAKYNFDRIVDPDVRSVGAGILIGPYESSEVVDEYTVQLHFSEPYGAFINALADPYNWITMVSPAAAEEHGQDFNLQPVGTGPFIFEEYVPQEMVSVVRNPDYDWAPEFYPYQGPARVDRVTFRFVSELSTRLAALETGEANISMELPPLEVQRIRDDDRFEVVSSAVPGVPVVALCNMSKPPLDDVLVRRAINYGVNQEAMVNTLFAGEWFAAHNILAPNTWAFDEESAEMYSYDPDRAAELLDEAGWVDTNGDGGREKDGEDLEVLYLALFAPPYDPGEVLQAQLSDL
jgi:peptide/nickel transport system substrate-binding protein